MGQLTREQLRRIIIVGFVLMAVASVINFLNSVSSVGFDSSFKGIVDVLVGPLGSIAAVCAWTALTRVRARDGEQLQTLRHAYIFFAIEYLVYAIGYNFIFTPFHSFGGFWTTAALWLYFLGYLTSAVGLFLLWRFLRGGDVSPRTE